MWRTFSEAEKRKHGTLNSDLRSFILGYARTPHSVYPNPIQAALGNPRKPAKTRVIRVTLNRLGKDTLKLFSTLSFSTPLELRLVVARSFLSESGFTELKNFQD